MASKKKIDTLIPYLKRRMEMQQQYGQSYVDTEGQIADKTIALAIFNAELGMRNAELSTSGKGSQINS